MFHVELLQDDFQILNLTNAEEKILLVLLDSGSSTVSFLARRAGVPRTTIYSALIRLKDRGLVKRTYKGHLRGKWDAVRAEGVKKSMRRTLSSFYRDKYRDKVSENDEIDKSLEEEERERSSESVEISMHRGVRNMLRIYETVVDEHSNVRIYVVQTLDSMKSQFEKVSPEAMGWFSDRVDKNGLIIDTVLPKEARQLYRETVRAIPRWRQYLGGRTSSTVLIEGEYLKGNLEIILIQDVVLLVNWEDEFLLRVRNRDIASAFSNFSALLKDTGNIFDMSIFVRQLVESEEKG